VGRLAGILAGTVYALRLLADALLIWRDVRGDPEEAHPGGAPDVGGAPEAPPPDRAPEVGPGRPAEGATAGEERGQSGPAVTSR